MRSAYNHLGLSEEQRRFGVILVPDLQGRLVAGVANAAMFGSSPVVCQFTTVSPVSAICSRRTLGLPMQAYIDDFAAPLRVTPVLGKRLKQNRRLRRAMGTLCDESAMGTLFRIVTQSSGRTYASASSERHRRRRTVGGVNCQSGGTRHDKMKRVRSGSASPVPAHVIGHAQNLMLRKIKAL